MSISNLLSEYNKKFNCTFYVVTTGSEDWVRAFIINSKGKQIGRLNFFKEKPYNIKNYKKDYIKDLCETDVIILRMNKYIFNNIYITITEYRELIETAKQKVEEIYQNQIQWREENPYKGKGKRKSLHRKGVRSTLTAIIHEYKGEVNHE